MKYATAFLLVIVTLGCDKIRPSPDPYPALTAACQLHKLKYHMWCYAAQGCYGVIFPADKHFANTSFETVVSGETPEDVSEKLVEASSKPLKMSNTGGEEIYSHDGGAQ